MAKPSFGKKEAPLDYGALVKNLRDEYENFDKKSALKTFRADWSTVAYDFKFIIDCRYKFVK